MSPIPRRPRRGYDTDDCPICGQPEQRHDRDGDCPPPHTPRHAQEAS